MREHRPHGRHSQTLVQPQDADAEGLRFGGVLAPQQVLECLTETEVGLAGEGAFLNVRLAAINS